ncbi:MAG: hypothetical protein VX897_05775 [Actinomycetota bacterium]|nr:hypothetical protein [Actinomycetota bacterium]
MESTWGPTWGLVGEMASISRPPVTDRRRVLAGMAGLAAGALLAACGGGRPEDTAVATTTSRGPFDPTGWRLGARFADGYGAPSTLVAGSTQRAPYVLLGSDGWPLDDEAPDQLHLTVRRTGVGGAVIATHTVTRHGGDDATPYFPLVFRVDDPGDYVVHLEAGDGIPAGADPHPLRVVGADEINLVQVGDALPAIATPTGTDPAGVNPICTEPNGPCSFHDHTVAEALERPGPVALLVSTPRFCQSDVCGPTVGLLRSALRVRSEPWTTVHAEVYTGPETGDFSTTAAVSALGLTFEPSLVVADAEGIITAGLHYTMDATEVAAALQSAV